jgi:osmotically-inducible protein OsmY
MMKGLHWLMVCGVAGVCIFAATRGWSQEGVGERVGQQVDRVFGQLREEAGELAGDVRQGFEKARAAVDRMSVEARLYARLHWDKALSDAPISVDVDRDGVALIQGTVSSEEAKAKAGQLAEDTVGVNRVTNDLEVAPPVSR